MALTQSRQGGFRKAVVLGLDQALIQDFPGFMSRFVFSALRILSSAVTVQPRAYGARGLPATRSADLGDGGSVSLEKSTRARLARM